MSHNEPTPIMGVPVLRTRPPDAWQEFTSWPGSTSLVTLSSAALLLAGLYGVIEPTIGLEGSSGPRWQVLGTLSSYLAALLSGIWAMCRARAGNPDAVASAVVGTAFAVGFGIIIHLIAPEQPGLALAAAIVGWLGLLLLGVGFVRCTGAGSWGALGWTLAALLAWTTLWPVLLSAVVAGEAARMVGAAGDVVGTDVRVMVWWSAGWGVLLVVLASFLVQAIHKDAVDSERPFLQRRSMRWVLVLVAVGSAIVALAVQAHIAGLDLAGTDCLPHLAFLILIANERRAHRSANLVRDAVAVVFPAALSAWLTISSHGPDMSGQFRGQGWAPDLVGLLGTAPVAPLLIAVVAAMLAWTRRAPGLWWGAGLAVILAILTWDLRDVLVAEAGVLSAAVGVVAAWRSKRQDLVVAVTAILGGCVPETRWAQLLTGHLPGSLLSVSSASAIVLLAATWQPSWVNRAWARIAAWTLGLLAAGLSLELLYGRRAVADLPGGQITAIALLLSILPLIGLGAWRRRDALLAAAILPCAAVLGWPLLAWMGRAWLAVWGAFALLGSGIWLAVRRARIPFKPF